MRVEVHAKPGASTSHVGGSHDGRLVVQVTERAVDGRATEAVRRAVAAALGVRAAAVSVVGGETSRRKVLDVDGDEAALLATIAQLRDGADSPPLCAEGG